MQLSHNHALCTVNHKGTAIRYHGYFTHVHVLVCGVITAFQAELHVKRSTVGFTGADGGKIGGLGRRYLVGIIFQANGPIITLDREMLGQDCLQTHLEPLIRLTETLQEFLVRFCLNLNEVRGIHNLFDLAETDSLLLRL